MFLKVENLVKNYGDKKILNNINFELEQGEILCILGPSGCGKTTILNAIGGFINIDKGNIILNNENITKLPPEKRKVCTVFQSYGLFTHKNVLENIEYGLKFQKINKKEKKEKIENIMKVVGLEGFSKRKIYELSGGQQQRVALARSIVISPSLLLLDEPFSNLDENLKDIMRKELKRLVNHFKMTAILVTHDQEDAFTVANKVILLNKGKIIQNDSPINMYNNPVNDFVANFIGKSNKLENNNFLRPECIKIIENISDEKNENLIEGEIIEVTFKGAFIEYTVKLENENKILVVELNNRDYKKVGEKVFIKKL